MVPQTLQQDTFNKIHEGHQGIERCCMRANSCVWWPGLSTHIAQKVRSCTICCRDSIHRKEPLITSPLPEHPWQVVGTDFFEFERKNYLVVVDYFSRYPELVKMPSTTSNSTISALKAIFARYGIPEVLRSVIVYYCACHAYGVIITILINGQLLARLALSPSSSPNTWGACPGADAAVICESFCVHS